MDKIARLVVWRCRKFTRQDLCDLVEQLQQVLAGHEPEIQPRERLNHTYKHHVRPACGFATRNGAVALLTLFVTHYNFLRPHLALGY
jgi:Integrase core domain